MQKNFKLEKRSIGKDVKPRTMLWPQVGLRLVSSGGNPPVSAGSAVCPAVVSCVDAVVLGGSGVDLVT